MDASVRVSQVNTIERLLKENQQWEDEVARYRRTWDGLVELLNEAFELATLLKGSLEDFDYKRVVAREDWLAIWGISNRLLESSTWI